MKRMTPLLALALVVTASCATTPASLSPISSFHDAIGAVLNASDFTLVTQQSGTQGTPPRTAVVTTVTKVVIEKPDKFSMRSTTAGDESPAVIAIGSVGYFAASAGEWTEYHHVGESTNFTNTALIYLHLLSRVTAVLRHGTTYVVPSTAAISLLASTRLTQFQDVTSVSLIATVESGLLNTVQLRVSGRSAFSMTATVSKVGSSLSITAPSPADIA